MTSFGKEDYAQDVFAIASDEAAHILGVNKTRLSQLTSKGIFSYERKNIEGRSRLFYKLGELLSYQRSFSFGSGSSSFSSFSHPSLENHNRLEKSLEESPDPSFFVPLLPRGEGQHAHFSKRSQPSAKECFEKERQQKEERTLQENMQRRIEHLQEEVHILRESIEELGTKLHLQLNRIVLRQSTATAVSLSSLCAPVPEEKIAVPSSKKPLPQKRTRKRKPHFYFG